MNFDDYANHILQKYRLAVAIAIVKNTPENYTPLNYLQKLRNNLVSQMESIDSDVTICEDDFNFNDDDNDCSNNDKCKEVVNGRNSANQTDYDSQFNYSVTILKDFNFDEMIGNMNNDDNESNPVSDALRVLKAVNSEHIIGAKVAFGSNDLSNNLNNTQSTYYESSPSVILASNPSPLDNSEKRNNNKYEESNTEYDKSNISNSFKHNKVINEDECMKRNITSLDASQNSQEIELCSLQVTDNLTHVSQSQANNIVLPRCLLDKKINDEDVTLKTSVDANFRKKTEELATDRTKYISGDASIDRIETVVTILSQNFNKDLKRNNENIEESSRRNCSQELNSNVKLSNVDVEVSGDNFSNESFTSNTNQSNDHKRPHGDIGECIEKVKAKRPRDAVINTNSRPNIIYFNETKTIESDTSLDFDFNISNFTNNETMETRVKKLMPDKSYGQTDRYFDANVMRNERHFDRHDLTGYEETINKIHNSQSFLPFSQEFETDESNMTVYKAIIGDTIKNTAKTKTVSEIPSDKAEEEMEVLCVSLTESQTELIPFKVLEEFNKIKAYLNKRDKINTSDCVSDSGYKSDSQSRNSFKSAFQSSNAWLNQSAHTLMSFIISCSLVANTMDITNQISRTLGQLIDRLHEEEKYPSFLEQHLETVEKLLKEVFEGVDNDKVMKKDEAIHRLFLLNKSSHVIKYTIEKIMAILENVHSILIQDLYELSNVNQFENLPHVFHILEMLIKKLIVSNKYSSQSTQNSQDEGILKRSTITDIWRRKWNLSKTADVETSVASTKRCVLASCSVLLNKIIVDAMDGYSLISFYALQCFNLLQN